MPGRGIDEEFNVIGCCDLSVGDLSGLWLCVNGGCVRCDVAKREEWIEVRTGGCPLTWSDVLRVRG